jgi:hypothetical protein
MRNHAPIDAMLVTISTTVSGTPRVSGAMLLQLPSKLTAKVPSNALGTATYNGSQFVLTYDDGYVVRFVKARDASVTPSSGAGGATVVVSTFDRLHISDNRPHGDVAKFVLR